MSRRATQPKRRKTPQRAAIRKAFLDTSHPMTPPEVLAAAQRHYPRLGMATVYRNLNALCEEGWLTPFDLPGERTTYYERKKSHHHHFVCRTCRKLYPVDCLAANFSRLLPRGFVLEAHEFLLYGLCAACARKTR
jgi:Fur family ferric uptake transcriptional regulator